MNRFIAFASLGLLLASSLLSSACVTQQKPEVSTLTGYRSEIVAPAKKAFQKEVYLGTEQAPMGTIAFSPPEACRSLTTFGASGKSDLVASNCGVLMTLLEEGAAKRGYRVVSWRNLIGSARPVDYAAQAKVDGLIEVNELVLINDKLLIGPEVERFAVYELHGEAAPDKLREDYSSDATLQGRCLRAWPQPFEIPAFAIDAKLTTVQDGQLRATYRNTAVMQKGEMFTETKVGWKQESAAITRTEVVDNAAQTNLLVWGAGVGAAGVVLGSLGGAIFFEELEVPSGLAEPLGGVLGVFGIGLLVGGAAMLIPALDMPPVVEFKVPADSPEPICANQISVVAQERTNEDAKAALRTLSRDLLDSILPAPKGR